jgi:hypothetical protein
MVEGKFCGSRKEKTNEVAIIDILFWCCKTGLLCFACVLNVVTHRLECVTAYCYSQHGITGIYCLCNQCFER